MALTFGVAERGEAVHHRSRCGDGGEALLDVIAMPLHVLGDETFQQRPIVGVDGSLAEKNLGDRSALVARPGVEGGDQADWSIMPFCKANRPKRRLRSAGSGTGMDKLQGRAPSPPIAMTTTERLRGGCVCEVEIIACSHRIEIPSCPRTTLADGPFLRRRHGVTPLPSMGPLSHFDARMVVTIASNTQASRANRFLQNRLRLQPSIDALCQLVNRHATTLCCTIR